MASNYFFAVKSIGLSKLGGRKPCTLLEAAKHNRRETQAKQGFASRIDPARSTDNETLFGPATADDIVALAARIAVDAGVNPKTVRRDHCQAVELVFSLDRHTQIDTGIYFRRCVHWVASAFLDTAVLSADIHRDEAAPHCHVLLSPVVGNRMAGSDLIDKKRLKALRDSFWHHVAGPAGLARPQAKLLGASKVLAAASVVTHLEKIGDPVLRSPLWSLTRINIEREPLPYLRALDIDPQSIRQLPKTSRTLF